MYLTSLNFFTLLTLNAINLLCDKFNIQHYSGQNRAHSIYILFLGSIVHYQTKTVLMTTEGRDTNQMDNTG